MVSQALRYPLATLDKESDYLLMNIIKYKPSKSSTLSKSVAKRNLSNGVGYQKPTSVASIILPIPTNIVAANGVTWNGATMNAIEEFVMTKSEKIMESRGADLPQEILQAGQEAGKILGMDSTADGFTSFISKKILQGFGSSVSFGQVLARSTGQVLNPNMELLFDGPGLRTFRFNYQLSPRSETEGNMVKAILRVMKKSMSPSRTSNKIFICTPDIFELKFKSGNGDHPFLNRFKQMALTNISVDYTGSGTYSVYENGTPTLINVALSFQELAPVYADDYDEKEGKIGAGF